MIYLIDDNQENQIENKYRITYIKDGKFNDFFTFKDKLEKNVISDISNLQFLKDADCILMHNTTEDYLEGKYISGSNTIVTKIKEQISCNGEKVPLVLFSNGMSEEPNVDYENNIIWSIKKNLFYEKLYDFLVYYQENKTIELRIFIYGKNFKAGEMNKYMSRVLKSLSGKNSNDILKITDLTPVKLDFEKFIGIAFPELSFNEIMIDIEDNPWEVSEFKKYINKVLNNINNYGENFNNWRNKK